MRVPGKRAVHRQCSISAGVFTEMEPIFKTAKNPYLVHLGTGIAAMGERRDDVLAKQIPDGVRYVGIGVRPVFGRTGFMPTGCRADRRLFHADQSR